MLARGGVVIVVLVRVSVRKGDRGVSRGLDGVYDVLTVRVCLTTQTLITTYSICTLPQNYQYNRIID